MTKDGAKKETKSDFLRKVLGKKPDLDYHQVNRLWTKKGHAGQISNALFYQVRAKLGIKSVWQWVPVSEPETKTTTKPGRGSAPRPAQPRPQRATGAVYQLKVTLLDTEPPVWRRILVDDCTLDTLHEHIQTAMGWTNSHLHHFKIGGTLFGDPMLMAENFEEFGYGDSTTTRLSDILPEGGKRFRFEYEYDFGDSWQHEILFEGRTQADPKQKRPVCLEGQRACPPEDVGGVWGYTDFVEAITDPRNEQHEELLEWVGGKFDPEAFSTEAATRRMRRGLPDWRDRW